MCFRAAQAQEFGKCSFKSLCTRDPRRKETFKPTSNDLLNRLRKDLMALTLWEAIPHVQPVVLAVTFPYQEGVVL